VTYVAEVKSDEALCAVINDYWRGRGLEAHARCETRAYEVPAKSVMSANGQVTHLSAMKISRREIVSDLVNGGPRTKFTAREEAPADHAS
jgi:hypothetical protein